MHLVQVRVGDRVYVCSTESGEVLELEYPKMKEVGGGQRYANLG